MWHDKKGMAQVLYLGHTQQRQIMSNHTWTEKEVGVHEG